MHKIIDLFFEHGTDRIGKISHFFNCVETITISACWPIQSKSVNFVVIHVTTIRNYISIVFQITEKIVQYLPTKSNHPNQIIRIFVLLISGVIMIYVGRPILICLLLIFYVLARKSRYSESLHVSNSYTINGFSNSCAQEPENIVRNHHLFEILFQYY